MDDTYKKELKWMIYIQKRVKMDNKRFNSNDFSKMLLIKFVMNLYAKIIEYIQKRVEMDN
jgi:hypothetical protein